MEVIIFLAVIFVVAIAWSALKSRDEPTIHVGYRAPVDLEAVSHRLDTDAIQGRDHPWMGKMIEFDYRDYEGGATRRRVTVGSVFESDGKQYIQGHCHLRDGTRNFRLDRIRGEIVEVETGEVIGGRARKRRSAKDRQTGSAR
jgi:hypothetical protein